jgi:hypothetical protein
MFNYSLFKMKNMLDDARGQTISFVSQCGAQESMCFVSTHYGLWVVIDATRTTFCEDNDYKNVGIFQEIQLVYHYLPL